MKRSGWLLLLPAAVLVAGLFAIWLVADLSDQAVEKRLQLSIALVAAVGVVTSAVVAARRLGTEEPASRPPTSLPPKGGPRPAPPLLHRDESIGLYLSRLQASLPSASSFVALSAEAEPAQPAEGQFLQRFEWAKRDVWQSGPTVTREPIDLLRAHERFDRYVLLGEPGSGKTACLQHLASTLIAEHRAGRCKLLPLYVSLSEWSDRRQTALEFLASSFATVAGPGNCLVPEFESLLARGELLVILDALNEMPQRRYYHEEAGEGIAAEINLLREVSTGRPFRSQQDPRERSLRQLATSSALRSRFVVSCRTHEFYGSPSWQEVYILPMDEGEIDLFLQAYLGREAAGLRAALGSNPALAKLARNPFFLRSMTRVLSPQLDLVHNRGQFLEYLCRELLDREKGKGLVFDSEATLRFVGPLAYKMLCRGMVGTTFSAPRNLPRHSSSIDALLGTGLVVREGEGRFRFYHQIVQEFFAAHALQERQVRCRLETILSHKKWTEVVVLWHDIDPSANVYLRLVGALDMRNRPGRRPYSGPPRLFLFDVTLLWLYLFAATNAAIDLAFRGSWLLPVIRLHPLASLAVLFALPACLRCAWLFSAYHAEGIANASHALARIGNILALPQLILALGRLSNSPRHRTEVAKALSAFGPRAVASLLLALHDKNCAIRLGAIEALGYIRDARAVEPLMALLKDPDSKVVAAACTALAAIGDPKAGPVVAETLLMPAVASRLMGGNTAGSTLQQFPQLDAAVLATLTEASRRDHPEQRRLRAIQAVGLCGLPQGVDLLLGLATDQTEGLPLRQLATRMLSFLPYPAATQAILHIYDRVADLREAALTALENVTPPEAAPPLGDALAHADWQVRRAAVRCPALLAAPAALEQLVRVSTDEVPEVRAEAAAALARLGTDRAVEPLVRLCYDPDRKARLLALEALDFAHPTAARDLLITTATDPSYPDRVRSVEILGRYRFAEVRDALTALCIDPDHAVRTQAAESLGRLDRSLAHEVRHVDSGRPRRGLANLAGWLRRRFLGECYTLWRRAAVVGVPETQRVAWMLQQMQQDSEVKRRLRPIFVVLVIAFLGIFVLAPPILAGVFMRGVLWLGAGIWMARWRSFVPVCAAIVSFAPGVRRGGQLRPLRPIYFVVRVLGVGSLLILALFGAMHYWWITLSIIAALSVVSFLCRRRVAGLVRRHSGSFATAIFAEALSSNPQSPFAPGASGPERYSGEGTS